MEADLSSRGIFHGYTNDDLGRCESGPNPVKRAHAWTHCWSVGGIG